MNPFPESSPAAAILATLAEAGPPTLGPESPRPGNWLQELRSLDDAALLDLDRIRDPDAAACVRSGLLLYGGDLDGSHDVSQAIHTPDGSYWHGIMHRREPDYGNSKYWFRRVGPGHPLFEELASTADASGVAAGAILSGGTWDPFEMVDQVESAVRGRAPELEAELLALQDLEFRLLLRHDFRRAGGR